MALPIAPLLSLGFDIVDKFFDKDEDKISTKERLLRLEAEGKAKELQKEVERLREITSIDTTSVPKEVDLVTRPTIDIEQPNLKWKDKLGAVVAYAFGFDLIVRPICNQVIEMYNAHQLSDIFPTMGVMSPEQMTAAISALIGVGGVSLIQQKMNVSDKVKQWFGK